MIPIKATLQIDGSSYLEVNKQDYVEVAKVESHEVSGYIHKFFLQEDKTLTCVFITDDGKVMHELPEFLTVDIKDYETIRRIKCQGK